MLWGISLVMFYFNDAPIVWASDSLDSTTTAEEVSGFVKQVPTTDSSNDTETVQSTVMDSTKTIESANISEDEKSEIERRTFESLEPLDLLADDSVKADVVPNTPFASHNLSTIVNSSGVYTSGKKIDNNLVKKAAIIRYMGDDIKGDIQIFDANGQSVSWNKSDDIEIPENYRLLVNNMGIYKNKVLQIELISHGNVQLMGSKTTNDKGLYFLGNSKENGFSFTCHMFLQEQERAMSNVPVMIPISKILPANNSYLQLRANNLENVISIYNKNFSQFKVDYTDGLYSYYWKSIDYGINQNYNFAMLYSSMTEFDIGSGPALGAYRMLNVFGQGVTVPIQIPYNDATIEGQTTENSPTMKVNVLQRLTQQFQPGFYEDLTLTVDLGPYVVPLSDDQLKFTANYDSILTNMTRRYYVSDEGHQMLDISFSKESVQTFTEEFYDKIIKLTIETPIEPNQEFASTYQSETEQFDLPVSVHNNHDQVEASTSIAHVGMYLEGTTLAQTVKLFSSSSELSPQSLVKDVNSLLNYDEVEIVGFSNTDPMVFDKVGVTELGIVIRSTAVDYQKVLPIEITVETIPAKVTVRFINEQNQVMDDFTVELPGYEVFDTIDLTQELATTINKIESEGYLITQRPENESAYVLEKEENMIDYHFTGTVFFESFPKTIDFGSYAFDFKGVNVTAPILSDHLSIKDTRVGKNKWQLDATLVSPLSNEQGKVINQAIRFNNEGSVSVLSDQPVLIKNQLEGGNLRVDEDWGTQDNGLQLKIDSSNLPPALGNYKADICWTIATTY